MSDDASRIASLEAKLEANNHIISRVEAKLDKLTELSTAIVRLEQEKQNQGNALDRAFRAIEKNSDAILQLQKQMLENNSHLRDKLKAEEDAREKLENSIAERVNMAKGAKIALSAVFGASGLSITGVLWWGASKLVDAYERIDVLENALRAMGKLP